VVGATVLWAGVAFGGATGASMAGFMAGPIRLAGVFGPSTFAGAHRFGAVLLVAASLVFPPWRSLLRTPFAQWLGRLSFSVYLLHIPLICSIACWVVISALPIGYHRAVLLAVVPFAAALIIASELSARLLDAPSVRASRIVGRWTDDGLARLLKLQTSRRIIDGCRKTVAGFSRPDRRPTVRCQIATGIAAEESHD